MILRKSNTNCMIMLTEYRDIIKYVKQTKKQWIITNMLLKVYSIFVIIKKGSKCTILFFMKIKMDIAKYCPC